MEIALTSRELIHLYLKKYINEVYIRKIIIDMKFHIEHQEDLRYHINQWDIIASAYYYTKDNQKSYSLVYSGYFGSPSHYLSHIFFPSNKPPQYIIIPDYIKDFYNITHFSYQSRELLHDLIKIYGIYGLHHMINDDILYSKLSLLIHLKMNN